MDSPRSKFYHFQAYIFRIPFIIPNMHLGYSEVVKGTLEPVCDASHFVLIVVNLKLHSSNIFERAFTENTGNERLTLWGFRAQRYARVSESSKDSGLPGEGEGKVWYREGKQHKKAPTRERGQAKVME